MVNLNIIIIYLFFLTLIQTLGHIYEFKVRIVDVEQQPKHELLYTQVKRYFVTDLLFVTLNETKKTLMGNLFKLHMEIVVRQI